MSGLAGLGGSGIKGGGWWQRNYPGGGLLSIKIYDLIKQNIAVRALHCLCSQIRIAQF